MSKTHNYFDKTYVEKWAKEESTKRPYRTIFYNTFVQEANKKSNRLLTVLELGSGPGFLAEQALKHCNIKKYYLLDFSSFMLNLSRKRLSSFADKTVFVKSDFNDIRWFSSFPKDFDLIVSLQAVHEVGATTKIAKLYNDIYQLLTSGGFFLMADLIKVKQRNRSDRLTIGEHLKVLKNAGFESYKEILTTEDLSLIKAVKY